MEQSMNQIISLLHDGGYSCVIKQGENIHTYKKPGVADLLYLLSNEPDVLQKAAIADKVVGAAAAALMVLGGVSQVYAETISQSGLKKLQQAKITVTYNTLAPYIQNRDKSGKCPLESLCADENDNQKIKILVEDFIAKMIKAREATSK